MKKIKISLTKLVLLIIIVIVCFSAFAIYMFKGISKQKAQNKTTIAKEENYGIDQIDDYVLDEYTTVHIPFATEYERASIDNEYTIRNSDMSTNIYLTFDRNLENYKLDNFWPFFIDKVNYKYLASYTIEPFFEDAVKTDNYELRRLDQKLVLEGIEGVEPETSYNSLYVMLIGNNVVYAEANFNNDIYDKNKNIVNYIMTHITFTDKFDLASYDKKLNQTNMDKVIQYNSLDGEQKKLYDELRKHFFEDNQEFFSIEYYEYTKYFEPIVALDNDLAYLGYDGYIIENVVEGVDPEKCFWKKTYLPETETLKIADLMIEGFKSKDEIKEYIKIANEIVDSMPEGLTTYGKYRYLADCLVQRVEYAYDEFYAECEKEETDFRIHGGSGALLDGRSVCSGYSATYKYLCKKAGLYCEEISITPMTEQFENWLDNEGHAFNYILLNDTYYFVDVTFMDNDLNDGHFAFIYEDDEMHHHYKYIHPYFEYPDGNMPYIQYGQVEDDFQEKVSKDDLYPIKHFCNKTSL